MMRPSTRDERKQHGTGEIFFRNQIGIVQNAEQDEHHTDYTIGLQALAGEQIDHGNYQIGPSYQSQNTPPTSLKRLSTHIGIDQQHGQQNGTGPLQGFVNILVASQCRSIYPSQGEPDGHEQHEPRTGEHAMPAAVQGEQSHHDQGKSTDQDMGDDL